MSRPLLDARAVAKRLSVTTTWFYKNSDRLEAEGFPKRLPGFRQGRWSADAIDAWEAEQSKPEKPAHPVYTELTVAEALRIQDLVKPPALVALEVEVTEPIREKVKDLLRSRGQAIARRHSGHA